MTRVPGSGTEPYIVISADGHAGLPCEQYRPYLDAKFHPAFDDFLAERTARREESLRFNYDYIMGWEKDNEEGLKGAFDPSVRDKELDTDGVAADLLFADADAITGMASPPFGAGLLAGAIEDPELAFAGARAHNRFLADLCAQSPHRRGGIALVPITHDVARAVAEIEWVAAQPGLRGIMVPTLWRSRPPYNDAVYDPVWAACAEAGLPVHTHSGDAPMEEYGEHTGVYLAEVVWWAVRPAWHLLFSGAFERHPRLTFVVTEAAAYWAPDMMWKWDQYMGGGHTTKKMAALLAGKISKLPSDYFGTNIFIGASTMSKEEIRRRYVIGTDVVMWGTDYPHPEGTWPHTLEKLQADFADVPVDDTADLLGLTAARVYGFDLEALAPVARRIGPTPELLGQDPARRRDPAACAGARWWKAEYGLAPRG
ncbi:MAG TPA: amidohydrolase family protein [Acidimicrobiales bacterium]|nr:amidohydrolase family protein [Acidimicrobiales bacterium]